MDAALFDWAEAVRSSCGSLYGRVRRAPSGLRVECASSCKVDGRATVFSSPMSRARQRQRLDLRRVERQRPGRARRSARIRRIGPWGTDFPGLSASGARRPFSSVRCAHCAQRRRVSRRSSLRSPPPKHSSPAPPTRAAACPPAPLRNGGALRRTTIDLGRSAALSCMQRGACLGNSIAAPGRGSTESVVTWNERRHSAFWVSDSQRGHRRNACR